MSIIHELMRLANKAGGDQTTSLTVQIWKTSTGARQYNISVRTFGKECNAITAWGSGDDSIEDVLKRLEAEIP